MNACVAVTSTCLFLLAWVASPASEQSASKLNLTSGFLFAPLELVSSPAGVHKVQLKLELDDKGGGSGQLELDPNRHSYNEFGDATGATEIAPTRVKVSLAAVKASDPLRKGRRLFEIQGEGLKARIHLLISTKDAGPHRILVLGKDGKPGIVLPLKEEAGSK